MRPGDTVVIDGGEIHLSWQIDGGEMDLSLQINDGEISERVPVYENNYNNLRNKPAINGVTLEGDLSSEDLGIDVGVTSVNGQTGDVTLDASDVGALPDDTPIPEKTSDLQNDSGYVNQTQAANAAPVQSVNGQTGDVSLDASDVGALPDNTPIPEKTSDLQNDSGFITGIDSSDVTEALGYTPYDASNPAGYLNEVTSQDVTEALGFTPYNATNPNGYVNQTQAANAAPVQNVNGKTGNVSLDASDVGALPDDTTYVSSFNGQTGPVTYQAPVQSVNGQTGNVQLQIPTVPTNVSAFTNDAGYLTSEDVGPVFTIKGSVYQYSDLPTTGNSIGDVYYVEEDETISGTLYPGQVGYIWITVNNVDRWEELGQTIDTSEFQPAINVSGVLQGDGNGGISSKPVDTSPSSGSSNLITSGAVYAAIIGAIEGSY